MKPVTQREKGDEAGLREDFLAWQCRIRQFAMRQDGGRPSPGMRPLVRDRSGRKLSPALTVLLVPRDPAESTDFFRFQVMKTADPRDLYERALAYLQADYFQQPESFGDVLTAVLPPRSELAQALIGEGRCVLEFSQFSQSYRLACAVFETEAGEPLREAALWHNRLFNPALPDEVLVLGFRPDWKSAEARRTPAD
jgi:hypothetical protein